MEIIIGKKKHMFILSMMDDSFSMLQNNHIIYHYGVCFILCEINYHARNVCLPIMIMISLYC